MPVLSTKWRAAGALCLLLIIFTACEYAPPPTSTPKPTITRPATETPTAAPATPTSAATVEASAAAGVTGEATAGASSAETVTVKAHVSVSTARVREAPNVRGKLIGQLKNGAKVIIFSKTPDSGYVYVEAVDGSLKGWSPLNSFVLDDPVAVIPVASPTP